MVAVQQVKRAFKALAIAFSVLLGLASTPCMAESSLQSGTADAPARATAHLDFRVTILPSIGMSIGAAGARVQANYGAVTVQQEDAQGWDGRSPSTSVRLQHERQVVDRTVQVASSGMLTIATP